MHVLHFRFNRLRINPSNMLIARDDYTFTYNTPNGNPVPYGSAGDCYSKSREDCRKGEFRINLNGTDMKLAGEGSWVAKGAPSSMQERITQFVNKDNRVISGHCGGSCAECQPKGGHIRLIPDMCLTEPIFDDEIKKETVLGMQKHKKSGFWWWW